MKEVFFFEHYYAGQISPKTSHLEACKNMIRQIYSNMPEIPFSNIWIASVMSKKLPENSVIHFGILNSLRAWNFFEIPMSVRSYSNVGGFGIDGGLSTLLGASFVNKDKLYFGNLAFFYDINSLGNRHVGNNVRIMLINNGKGTEFRHYTHPGSKFEDRADDFIAAGGHYGNKSKALVKHYAEDLGFDYLCASSKEEFLSEYEFFVDKKTHNSPVIFEVFTKHDDESNALKAINTIMFENPGVMKALKHSTTQAIKNVIGPDVVKAIKKDYFSK